MATRALIGMHIPATDEIKYVYIHHGHPSDIGERLKTDYHSDYAVSGLIDGGGLSSFGKDGVAGVPDYYKDKEGEDWDAVRPKCCYSRDELVAAAKEQFIDYVYIWKRQHWEVSCTYSDEYGAKFDDFLLDEAMAMIAADTEGRW